MRSVFVWPRTPLSKWRPPICPLGLTSLHVIDLLVRSSLLPMTLFMKQKSYIYIRFPRPQFSFLMGENVWNQQNKRSNTKHISSEYEFTSPVHICTWWKLEIYMFDKKRKHRVARDHQGPAATRPERIGVSPQGSKGLFSFCSGEPNLAAFLYVLVISAWLSYCLVYIRCDVRRQVMNVVAWSQKTKKRKKCPDFRPKS